MSVVAISNAHTERIGDAVREAVALTGDFASAVPRGASVLIKPNVLKPAESGSGIITDVRVLEAVIELTLERKPGRLVVGEGSSVGYDFPDLCDSRYCMDAAGVTALAHRYGLEVVDLNRDQRVVVTLPDAYVMDRFAVARAAWMADVIIDLPVLKTHVRTGITCGLKNMKGVLPSEWKKRTHQLGLDHGIADLNRALTPHFVVVDAVTGRQGTHAYESDRVTLNCVVAGSDVVAVDAVCASIAGFDPASIKHLQLAAEAGLGIADIDRIDVRGNTISEVRRPFIPFLHAARELYGGAEVIDTLACTGCMGEAVSTFTYLKQAGWADRLRDLRLVMGTPADLSVSDRRTVVVGRCARDFRHHGTYVPGCPPHGMAITDGVCDALEIDRNSVQRAIAALHGTQP